MTTGNSQSCCTKKPHHYPASRRTVEYLVVANAVGILCFGGCMTDDNPKPLVHCPMFQDISTNRVAVDPPTDATIAVICSSLII